MADDQNLALLLVNQRMKPTVHTRLKSGDCANQAPSDVLYHSLMTEHFSEMKQVLHADDIPVYMHVLKSNMNRCLQSFVKQKRE